MQIKPDPCTEEHFFQLMAGSTLYTDICFNCKNSFSDNNTYQAAPGIVDDLLHGILQLRLAFLSDGCNLVSDPVLHKLFNRLAENISLPDTLSSVPAFLDIPDQVFRLLLRSHDGRDLRLDICLDHMNGRAL